MATFGPIASSVPNVLFDAARVDRDVQAFQRNQLLMENSRADQGYQNFDRDRQEVARVSASLLSLPPEQRPQAYAASVQQLQAQGFARRAPAQYPGDQQIEALARQGMSATDQFSLVEKRRASEALLGALGMGAGLAPMGAAPVASVQPASLSVPSPAQMPAGGVSAPAGGGLRSATIAGQRAAVETYADDVARAREIADPVQRNAELTRIQQQRGLAMGRSAAVSTTSPATQAIAIGDGVAATPVADTSAPARAPAPAVPAAPAGPALPQIGANGLTREQTALVAAAAGANPNSVIPMVTQFRQQNAMAMERAADNQRAERQFAAQQAQQAEANRRADEAARRADDAARRQDETARRQADQAGVPAGYRRNLEGGLEPIPGGPAERAEREAADKARREANPGPSATDRTKLRGIETEAQGILEALETFRTTRASATTADRARTVAGAPTALSSSYANAALLMKGEALYNLGVLNGPDLDIIRRALADPSTVRGGVFTDQAEVERQIDQAKTLLQQRLATARAQYGGQDATAAPARTQEPGQRGPEAPRAAPPAPFVQAVAAARAKLGPNASDDDVVREAARTMGAR